MSLLYESGPISRADHADRTRHLPPMKVSAPSPFEKLGPRNRCVSSLFLHPLSTDDSFQLGAAAAFATAAANSSQGPEDACALPHMRMSLCKSSFAAKVSADAWQLAEPKEVAGNPRFSFQDALDVSFHHSSSCAVGVGSRTKGAAGMPMGIRKDAVPGGG